MAESSPDQSQSQENYGSMRVYEHEPDTLNDSGAGIVFAVDEEEMYARAEVVQLSSRHTLRNSIDE